MSCPRICGQSHPKSLQISVVLRAGILVRQDKCSGKSRVCNGAIERQKSSRSANTPEDDGSSDGMDSVGQRDQTRDARDYQRHQTDRYQYHQADDQLPSTRILYCSIGFHKVVNTVHSAQRASIESSRAQKLRVWNSAFSLLL